VISFMPTSKLSATIYLSLVFLSGILVGGVSYRVYSLKTVSASTTGSRRATPEEFRRRYVNDLRTRLNLDEKEVSQIQQILDQTDAEFHQLRANMNAQAQTLHDQQVARIKAILAPDQEAGYDQFRAEREKKRKAENKGEKR
jgi:hypothetical protein